MSDGKKGNDAGSHFSHYQLAHEPPGAVFQGPERQRKREVPVAAVAGVKRYGTERVCV